MNVRFNQLTLLAATTLALVGCKTLNSHRPIGTHNLPPAQMLMEPGPGVGGPGPGVMMHQASPGIAVGGMVPGGPSASSQIAFAGPDGMTVSWDVGMHGAFDSEPLICPGRQNFPQGGIYRLKLTDIPGREGSELYPTLEVGPVTPRTDAYLAHTPIPVQFTEEDFDQVQSGNFVIKVIYLPDPEFQDLALAGVETLVSTRLDPGVDPIAEADRRGSILGIVRLGNKDLELPAAEELDGAVIPASYNDAAGINPAGYGATMAGGGAPIGMRAAAMAPAAYPPGHVSGVTGPQWGMPMSGTPIGLPGPPHVPLGVPAGLQKHVVRNNTHHRIPDPTDKMTINVKQRPGFSYPKPVSRVWIKERVRAPFGLMFNPWANKKKTVVPEYAPPHAH